MAYSYIVKKKKRFPYLLNAGNAAENHMALAAKADKGGYRSYRDTGNHSSDPNPKGREYAANQYGQGAASTGAQTAQIGTNALESYYRALLELFSVPGVTVQAPSYDELGEAFESIMRPGVDTAIDNRYEAGALNMAELEADAYSRGMGSSSFVSSMNAREQDDIQTDIAAIEAQYAAAIAEPIAPTTAARYRGGRSAGHKYDGEVPGQGKVQGINRARTGGYYDEALMPTTRNKRDVWHINTVPYKGGHFAAFPPKLAETCILAGCPRGGIVLDPFFGSGTTGLAAKSLDRHYIGIELNYDYCTLARARIGGETN